MSGETMFRRNAFGSIVGSAHIDNVPEGLILTSIWVRPDMRGTGVGRNLMLEVCCKADRLDVPIALYVAPSSDSPLDREALIRMYERYGFELSETDPTEGLMIRGPRAPQILDKDQV